MQRTAGGTGIDTFLPPRRNGLILHAVVSVLLLSISLACFSLSLKQQVGSYFLLLLLISLILLPPAALAVYRGLALIRASYTIERDGLRLRWGLRGEDIPLPDIEWIRPASDMGFNLPMPFLHPVGSILGKRNIEGLGVVEFMASEADRMLLIATPRQVFVISPSDPSEFIFAFQRSTELGSLAPLASNSTQPAAFLQGVWSDLPARILLLSGLVISLILFITVSLIVPSQNSISLGFDGRGAPMDPGPPERLLLLPVLAGMVYAVDLLLGLLLYRMPENRPVAYLLWTGSVMTPILLFIGTLFLIQT